MALPEEKFAWCFPATCAVANNEDYRGSYYIIAGPSETCTWCFPASALFVRYVFLPVTFLASSAEFGWLADYPFFSRAAVCCRATLLVLLLLLRLLLLLLRRWLLLLLLLLLLLSAAAAVLLISTFFANGRGSTLPLRSKLVAKC